MELIEAGYALAAAGLVVGTSGNVSVRDGDRVLLSPKGAALGELTADDVAAVSRTGEVLAGAPTSELELHLAIYRRYDAVFTHFGTTIIGRCSTSCRSCITTCWPSAVRFAWRRSPRSARRSWHRR